MMWILDYIRSNYSNSSFICIIKIFLFTRSDDPDVCSRGIGHVQPLTVNVSTTVLHYQLICQYESV